MSELMLRGILLCPFDDHGDIVLMQLRGACGQAVEEMDRLRADCECYEAMKEGVLRRIADLEAERDQFAAWHEEATTELRKQEEENAALRDRCERAETELTWYGHRIAGGAPMTGYAKAAKDAEDHWYAVTDPMLRAAKAAGGGK